MIIDLVLVAVLGAALVWSQPDVAWKTGLFSRLMSLGHFGRALLRTHLGHLLLLLSIAAALQWGAQIATSGWRVIDPALAAGEVDEETRCHAWLERLVKEGVDTFAPSEFVCPAGGGAYARGPQGEPSCSVHGASP